MEYIKDEKKLDALLDRYHIRNLFDCGPLPFRLVRFKKGEFISSELDPLDHLSFVVSGRIRIFHIRDDGGTSEISSGSSFTCLGDLEFASGHMSPYLIEALDSCLLITLPLKRCRKEIENDPVFLRFLLSSIAEKTEKITAMNVVPGNLKERVIFHMRNNCENSTLKGVEQTAGSLLCSKRQLLRILKELCAEGTVVKTGRGKYMLENNLHDRPAGTDI